nr:helix-turn-helix transcriptional regulator [Ensifer sp. LC163]
MYRNKYEVAVNPAQARAARAILKLGVREVAELAKVTANTVSRVEQDEAGPRGPQPVTVEAIKRVYEARGVIFFENGPGPDGGPGVRLANR